jgi:quinol monooxygenase YgiN
MIVSRSVVVFMAVAAGLVVGAFGQVQVQGEDPLKESKKMHGLIGKMTAVEGKRDSLIAILLEGTKEMPGCLSYIIAKDPTDATTIFVTEVWDSQESHQVSLSLPAVREAITKGKPMIAKFDQSVTTEPVGGHGLTPAIGLEPRN